ncbi:hypothetical protein DFH06DRAFT_1349063 [Mycena polygramma]|nr:hypothetical protein DFH06DRAFT_1349063 [Mycena polygramma]
MSQRPSRVEGRIRGRGPPSIISQDIPRRREPKTIPLIILREPSPAMYGPEVVFSSPSPESSSPPPLPSSQASTRKSDEKPLSAKQRTRNASQRRRALMDHAVCMRHISTPAL